MRRRPALFAFLLLAMPAGGRAHAGPDPAAPPPPADESRGLWVGPIHLCRDTVLASKVSDTEEGPFPSLVVTLRPDLRDELRRETERRVARTMPIRLDGRVISEPVVHEPITGGVLAIAGTSADETEAIQDAVRRPC